MATGIEGAGRGIRVGAWASGQVVIGGNESIWALELLHRRRLRAVRCVGGDKVLCEACRGTVKTEGRVGWARNNRR